MFLRAGTDARKFCCAEPTQSQLAPRSNEKAESTGWGGAGSGCGRPADSPQVWKNHTKTKNNQMAPKWTPKIVRSILVIFPKPN